MSICRAAREGERKREETDVHDSIIVRYFCLEEFNCEEIGIISTRREPVIYIYTRYFL